MFAKLILVIVALALLGCALLGIRQSRMQAAHDLAQTRLKIAELDAELWMLRAEIAERVTPSRIRAMADAIGPIEPVTPEGQLSTLEPEVDVATLDADAGEAMP